MNQTQHAIVVGVGRHGSHAAVEFAIAEGQRTQSPVHLVQVVPPPITVADAGVYPLTAATADDEIEQSLAYARRVAIGTETEVSKRRVDSKQPVAELVRLGNEGRMVVLQQRRLNALQRIFTGSTINGVAARADVPVVSVPEDWSTASEHTRVTVAVQDTGEATNLLRAGFEQASSRGARLVVLHAWWVAGGYDMLVVDEDVRRDWAARIGEALAPTMGELKAEFPDVEVELQVRHAAPIDVLIEAGQESALLILGRRHHLLPLGSHLGPVARTTLHHSSCPVLMVPAET